MNEQIVWEQLVIFLIFFIFKWRISNKNLKKQTHTSHQYTPFIDAVKFYGKKLAKFINSKSKQCFLSIWIVRHS